MNIVFCADRRILPGLHVAAFSVLSRMAREDAETVISVFSDSLTPEDIELLRQTLDGAGRPYRLIFRRVDPQPFEGFPLLKGSSAAYFRLVAAEMMDVERFLYLDCDVLCRMDVSPLMDLDLGSHPVGWVPEAPMSLAVDRVVAQQLEHAGDYFNSGVLLVNTEAWRKKNVTARALQYIETNKPNFHDQSALNVVLHGKGLVLDTKYNLISNIRKNWPLLATSISAEGALIHFLDNPKPWDFLAEWIHPLAGLWQDELARTAMKTYRSWRATPARTFPTSVRALAGYQKTLKDRMLFAGYRHKWLKHIEGVPSETDPS